MKNKKSKVQNQGKGFEPSLQASTTHVLPIKLPPTLHVLPLARNPHEERTLLSRSRQAPKLARRVRIELTQQDLESRSPALGHSSALKIGTPDGI